MNDQEKPLGERLEDIGRRLDAAYLARDKHDPLSPEWAAANDALEAVYVDLRAWNKEAGF